MKSLKDNFIAQATILTRIDVKKPYVFYNSTDRHSNYDFTMIYEGKKILFEVKDVSDAVAEKHPTTLIIDEFKINKLNSIEADERRLMFLRKGQAYIYDLAKTEFYKYKTIIKVPSTTLRSGGKMKEKVMFMLPLDIVKPIEIPDLGFAS